MGKFAKTSVVEYYFSFADQGKQTSVFPFPFAAKTEVCCFRFMFAANKEKLPFSICRIPETWRHGHGEGENNDMEMETWKHGNIYMRHGNIDK